MEYLTIRRLLLRYWDRLHFQIHQQIRTRDVLGSLNKPKIPGYCIFPMANLKSAESLYCVPKSNLANFLILLYICSDNISFWGAYLQNGCIAGIYNSAKGWVSYTESTISACSVGKGL